MTPTEIGSPTCHVATSEDKSREFIDLLLDNGEHTALMDALAIDTDTEDIDDVTGWGCSVSLPRPPQYVTRRTAVNPPTTTTNASGVTGLGGFRKKSFKQNNVPEMDLSNMKVRCVNEDYAGDHQKSHWKGNVEPGTYRYISNNGIYRANKFANVGSDWVTAKRSRHIENSPHSNNPEVKQAQKNLRKDLDYHFKLVENMKNETNSNNFPPSTPIRKTRDPRNQQQQESSASGNNINNNHYNAQIAKAETDSLPPPSRPPKDPQLVKSASDLFVENFSSRISALEKSEKEANSNNNSGHRSPGSPSKMGGSTSLNNQNSNTNNNKRQLDHHFGGENFEDISKDVFTVRPVTRAPDLPLGPLEKLTPQQKMIERASDSECSSHQSKSQPDSPSLMTAMNAFSQLHQKSISGQHQHRNKDNNNKQHSRSNPNTHRHPYKSSSMSNVSDADSINSVRNALTLTNSNIERMRMGSYGKSPIKDYGRFLSSSRPKVANQNNTNNNTSAFGRTIGSTNHTNHTNHYSGSGFGGSGLVGSNINKNTVVGYKTLSAPVTHGANMRPSNNMGGANNLHPVITSTLQVDDVSCGVSETESYLSGTSLSVNRGSGSLRDGKESGGNNNGMQLPGIAGKRMAVAATTQRML